MSHTNIVYCGRRLTLAVLSQAGEATAAAQPPRLDLSKVKAKFSFFGIPGLKLFFYFAVSTLGGPLPPFTLPPSGVFREDAEARSGGRRVGVVSASQPPAREQSPVHTGTRRLLCQAIAPGNVLEHSPFA